MRTATVAVIGLCLAWSVGARCADPPPPKSAPAPTAPATGSTSAPAEGSAPGAARSPPSASEPGSSPDRIDPTEKVHSDSEISFPVDI